MFQITTEAMDRRDFDDSNSREASTKAGKISSELHFGKCVIPFL
jgi:hypothetical protein